MLTEEDLKRILMDCKCQSPNEPVDPNGLYTDNLDIIEFGHKVEEEVALKFARKERRECIKFVRSLNHIVADALESKRGPM